MRPDGAFALGVLLAASGLLLLLAWVHVAGLLFARASSRTAEIGVRLAIGASRLRLIRQFVIEAGVLVAIAMALAVALTPGLTTSIVRMLPAEITIGQDVAPDARAFAFLAAVSTVGLLLIALAPIGLVLRIFGKDPMHRRFERDAATYWVDARPPRPRESYFRQF